MDGCLKNLFPIFGLTIGEATSDDLRAKGYFVETIPGGDHVCNVRGLCFWDHDQDDIYEDIHATNASPLPEAWEEKYGLTWHLSYNGWISKLKDLGFEIEVHDQPHIEEYDGHETLVAFLTATSPDGELSLDLDFQMGNDYGEGAYPDSPRSLYAITVSREKIF